MQLGQHDKLQLMYALFGAHMMPKLKEQWEVVRKEITSIVAAYWQDFDFDGAQKFERYINFHTYVRIHGGPVLFWDHPLVKYFGLEAGAKVVLVDFKFPWTDGSTVYISELGDDISSKAIKIIKTYTSSFDKIAALWDTTKEALASIRTTGQLEERLPELANYLPPSVTKQTTAVLPVETYKKVRMMFSSASTEKKVDNVAEKK